MLETKMMQEIHDLKLSGYSISEIVRHFKTRDGKSPSLPTIRKYYNMDSIPDVPNEKLQKEKAFDIDPFRGAIIKIINNCRNHCYSSSVYDVLIERFVDSGEYDQLPGNEQTLRNYVRYLKENGLVDDKQDRGRTYDYVFDTPPGDQMLIDFGEYNTGSITVHFLCLLLRYSRVMYVLAQDHKFNAEEACRGIYRGFAKLGGRPEVLVIDQDAVFVASETYGEVILTDTFERFLSEQGLKLWVCNKGDPESKGPVENMVGFVKKNFFSARTIIGMDDVWRSLPGWIERKNKRVHKTTFCIPAEVFEDIERDRLRPLLPSVFENSPLSFKEFPVGSFPYIQYKASKYSVGQEHCFTTVLYKVTGDVMNIYDINKELICKHKINSNRGSINRLEEHKQDGTAKNYVLIVERMRDRWNCYSFQHFVNGFKKENGSRYVCQQLTAVEKYLIKKQAAWETVAAVMKVCCERYRYRFTQFQAVYEMVTTGYAATPAVEFSDIQKQDMAFYQTAFEARCIPGSQIGGH